MPLIEKLKEHVGGLYSEQVVAKAAEENKEGIATDDAQVQMLIQDGQLVQETLAGLD